MVQNHYLHIPFCRQKCPYCKFALTPIFDEVKKKRYLGYLRKEIREYFLVSSLRSEDPLVIERDSPSENDKIEAETIYFGGGTPSVLSLDEVREILDCFPIIKNSNTPTLQHSLPEISFECNPEDITSEYVSGLLELGINRLSIGVQSLNNETLKAIHRSDRASIFQALESIEFTIGGIQGIGVSEEATLFERRGKQGGDERQQSESEFVDPSGAFGTFHSGKVYSEKSISLNIDFILGLPFSKPGETLENIRELHERFPFITHTSVYMLEDGLYPKEWKKESISERDMQREYGEICEYFDSLGWHHYEISSWAKPGYKCQHNMGYWNHADTRGFGLSATSYVDGKRWTNSDSFAGYYRGDVIDTEILTEEEKNLEKIIHELRTFRLHDNHFPDSVLDELERGGLIERKDRKIILTPAGIFRENTILSRLIEK